MKDMFKKLGLFIFSIAICALVVFAASDPDVPINTVSSPGDLSTEMITQGLAEEAVVTLVFDTTVPSGDSDAELVNATLWLETGITEVNNTGFVGIYNNGTLAKNQTISITGSSNVSATFSGLVAFIDGEYIMWNVLTCNEQNNCSWLDGNNKTFLMDSSYDTTDGTIETPYPVNGSVSTDASPVINFTTTDDVWVKNVTLFFNYTEKNPFVDEGLNFTSMSDLFFNENETYTNTGAVSPFDSNNLNTSISGQFSTFQTNSSNVYDGWYTYYIESCDYNANCVYTDNGTFELDTTVPEISMIDTISNLTVLNNSVSNISTVMQLQFNMTEPANVTIEWGPNTTTNTGINTISEFVNSTTRVINLTGLSGNTAYFIDITICDEHGNCNYTAAVDYGVHKEYSVTAGYVGFGILNTSVRLQDIRYGLNDDVASGVHAWNQSSQSFINYVPSLSTNENYTLSRGDAVLINADSDTFVKVDTFLEESNTEIYDTVVSFINGTEGNWTNFGALLGWDMNNITHDSGLQDNVTYISIFDNDDHRYVDHIVDWLWNNDTVISKATNVWMWGDQIASEYQWNRNTTFVNITTIE